MSKKVEKVNSLIQRELGSILLKDVEFPQGSLVTITRVETSIDLINARVYISVLPQEGAKRVLEILGKLVFFLQKRINKRLKMRPIPKIRFIEEKETGKAARIESILEDIRNQEG
ncbi:30S ribosome-binding factor RbfA [Patescibacteria group bacterium]|nr:30S ribosome-binding factor RbfA [Patescibacteria group bacterium]